MAQNGEAALTPTMSQERKPTMGRSSTFKFMANEERGASMLAVKKSAMDAKFIADVLSKNPNLQKLVKLNDDHIQQLIAAAWREDFQVGQYLMSEGDLSNEIFYIVAKGSFEIVAYTPFEIIDQAGVSYLVRPEEPDGPMENKPKTVRVAGRGLCIGDLSMVYNQPRLVTATAKEKSEVFAISQSDFKNVQNQALQDLYAKGSSKGKTPEDETLISEVLRLNKNLQRLVPLTAKHIEQAVAVAVREELSEGHVLMYEGDLNAEAFYIIGEGELEATGSEPFEVVYDGGVSYFHRAAHTGQEVAEAVEGNTVRVVGRGHCFGEISMLHCAPRFATLKANKKSVLWTIDRANFQIIQMKGAEEHMRQRIRYLQDLEVAANLPMGAKEALAGLMDTMRFTEGEVILQEGAQGTAMYILYEGTVVVKVSGKSEETLEANPGEGTHHNFADVALRKDALHPATVQVTSAIATVLVLQRNDFEAVWDQLLEGVDAPVFERLYTTKGPRKDELSLSNLSRVGLLGSASFGPVELVKQNNTGETYALKTMNKGLVAHRGMIKSLMREKDVWAMLTSPFIIKLITTFNNQKSVIFLLESALGGDLGSLYERESLAGSVKHAQYYLSGVVYALDCMHRLKVAYRNLKPQNVLISHLGRPKLTNMALSKVVIGQTFTMCGTPDYMAPEVLAGTGHTRAVDWWSLGVLLFELMAGKPPFESDHPMRVYFNIMRGVARLKMPENCSGAVGDLIGLLLKPQAIERLPMRKGGITNIMEHKWFENFNWQQMRTLMLDPPYTPKLEGKTDISNFKANKEALPTPIELHGADCSWEKEFGPVVAPLQTMGSTGGGCPCCPIQSMSSSGGCCVVL